MWGKKKEEKEEEGRRRRRRRRKRVTMMTKKRVKFLQLDKEHLQKPTQLACLSLVRF